MSFIFNLSTKVLEFFKYPIAIIAGIIFLVFSPLVLAAVQLKILWHSFDDTKNTPSEVFDKDRQ